MREIRPSGSEGGGAELNRLSLPLSIVRMPCSSSTPATFIAKSTAPTVTGPKRKSAFWLISSGSTAAKSPDFTLGGEDAKAKLQEIFGFPSPGGRRGGDEGSRFTYRDVPGLCKSATIKEIEGQGWSLNPGRYVGVAPGEAVSDEDFKEQLETLNEELEHSTPKPANSKIPSPATWRRSWRREAT